MLTDSLRSVVARMEALPVEEQEALAAAIRSELETDARWAAAMDAPEDLMLDQLIAQAKEEVAQGEACDLDELL